MRRLAFVCVCACVLGLAGSTAGQTRVAFLAAGDYGVGGSAELRLGRAMQRYEGRNPANMVVLLGDNDYTQNPPRFRTNWRATFGWARRSGLRVSGVLGNHDYHVNRGRYELGLLGMPRPYYTRKLGDIQLFLLDSNEVNNEQTAWLEGKLAESSAIWKIVAFHHPPYTCGGHSGAVDVQERWVPLFEQYGVQLVLSGHDHNYQRFAVRNGVRYVVHGGGAAGLYSLRDCPASYPRRVQTRIEHGFLFVVAGPSVLTVNAVDMRGRTRDRVSIQQ